MKRIEKYSLLNPSYLSYVITSRCIANCDICLTPTNDPKGKKDLITDEAK